MSHFSCTCVLLLCPAPFHVRITHHMDAAGTWWGGLIHIAYCFLLWTLDPPSALWQGQVYRDFWKAPKFHSKLRRRPASQILNNRLRRQPVSQRLHGRVRTWSALLSSLQWLRRRLPFLSFLQWPKRRLLFLSSLHWPKARPPANSKSQLHVPKVWLALQVCDLPKGHIHVWALVHTCPHAYSRGLLQSLVLSLSKPLGLIRATLQYILL